jgi:nucleoid-associated protein YgaU
MPGPAPGPAAPPARGPVSLQVVDYDQRGEVRFAGTAAPNAPVRVYVNNNPVGDAVAGSDGRWTLTPVAPVSPGVHQLRIDQLLPSGQVAGRVEAPFQRVEIPPESLRDGQVVVQPGQSLWRIARGAYGRGVRYTVIYQANREQIRDPARIYPGQVFSLPTATN